ncbi:MAG: hypothetical protein ACXWIS_22485 [Burkholderiales bacterium]
MEPFKRISRVFECRKAVRLDFEVTFGFAAARSGRLAGPRRNQSFSLQTLECRVDRTNHRRTTRYALNFSANHRPVCAVAQTENCQQNDMLKLTEVFTLRHNICIIDNM